MQVELGDDLGRESFKGMVEAVALGTGDGRTTQPAVVGAGAFGPPGAGSAVGDFACYLLPPPSSGVQVVRP